LGRRLIAATGPAKDSLDQVEEVAAAQSMSAWDLQQDCLISAGSKSALPERPDLQKYRISQWKAVPPSPADSNLGNLPCAQVIVDRRSKYQ
jgi:hypothetical protein